MLIPILILLSTLLVLVVMYAVDDAVRVLNVRAGLPTSSGMRWSKRIVWLILAVVFAQFFIPSEWFEPPPPQVATYGPDSLWTGADTTRIVYLPKEQRDLVRYGRELIANTTHYLGPNGVVMRNTNALNCQNCHLDAGTKPWGNNYGAVWSTYPKMRARSGRNETVAKRINDCVERSLNGTALDTTGREMQAMMAYMEWLGSGIEKGVKPKGSGIMELAFLDRAADPMKGAQIYAAKCQSCHAEDGAGILNADGHSHQYPPLWGDASYNEGAGLFRMSRFAGYVKANMPFGASWEYPLLSDEEAWDVAAYVNAQRHPTKDLDEDWPDISKKPVDHPFGPYTDTFPEYQHKYGPFGPIVSFYKSSETKTGQAGKP
jgi:thiosulfate dehydrogenase